MPRWERGDRKPGPDEKTLASSTRPLEADLGLLAFPPLAVSPSLVCSIALQVAPAPERLQLNVEFDPRPLPVSSAALRDALSGHVSDLGVRVVVVGIGAPPDPAVPPHEGGQAPQGDPRSPPLPQARLQLGVRVEGTLEIRLWQPGDTDPWVRRIPAEPDTDLMLESLGIVVHGMLTTDPPLPARPEPAVETSPQPAARPPALEPPRSSTPPRPAQLDLRLAYRGETLARSQPWHHGVALGLSWESPAGLVVEGSAAWNSGPAGDGLSIQRVPIQLAGGWRFLAGARVRPSVWALGNVEALGWSGAGPDARARPGWAIRAAGGAAGDLQIELSRGWFGFARATGRVWARGAQLVQEAQDGNIRLLQTSVVSAEALVGVGYHIFFIRNRRRATTARSSE